MPIGVIDFVFLTVGAVLIALAVLRVRRVRWEPASSSQIALSLMLASFGLAFVVQAPLVRGVQNLLFPQMGQLTGNGLTLVAAFFAQVMVLAILYEDVAGRIRQRLVVLVLALTGMTGLFLTNPVGDLGFTTPDEGPNGVTLPPIGILAYYGVYLVCVVVALVELLVLVNRYAHRTEDRFLRAGLRIVAVGCVVGLIYAAGRTVVLVISQLGVDVPIVEFLVGVIAPSIGVLLVAGGSTFSRWAPLAASPLAWARYRRADRRLEPLWEAARQARPDLVLDTSPMRAGLRLYRHIIEIQDVQLLIALRLDPAVRQQAQAAADAAGLTGADADTVVEAAVFAVGIQLLQHDLSPSTEPKPAQPSRASTEAGAAPIPAPAESTASQAPDTPSGPPRANDDRNLPDDDLNDSDSDSDGGGGGGGGGRASSDDVSADLAATARHLEQVADAYRRSPAVQR